MSINHNINHNHVSRDETLLWVSDWRLDETSERKALSKEEIVDIFEISRKKAKTPVYYVADRSSLLKISRYREDMESFLEGLRYGML